MPTYDEAQLADLLRRLPPVREAWLDAAKALPRVRRELDRLLPLIECDAELREAMTQDLESVLRRVGVEPEAPLVEALCRRLGPDDSAPEP
jgi:hypothetical protein